MLEQIPAASQHLDQGSLWTTAITASAGALTTILAWTISGRKVRLSAEESMRTSFQLLVNELQKENLRLINNMEKQEAKIDALTREVGELKEFSMQQTLHIERLERSLSDAGLAVPRSNRA
jgi:hypothetical protein